MSTPSRIGAKKRIDPDLPQHPSLVHMLREAVDLSPDVTAVIEEERRISYAQFGRAVNGLDELLRQRGVSGSRVIIMMPNCIEMDVALMAVMSAGAQVAPVNPFFTPTELKKTLASVDPAAVICDAGMLDKAGEITSAFGIAEPICMAPDRVDIGEWTSDAGLDGTPSALPGPDDPALLIFTGGSTGIPKGVDHSHRGLVWSLLQHVSVWPLEPGKERFLNVAPMFHIWGLAYATWVPIFARGTLVMVPKYEPGKVIAGLHEHRVTVFAGGPAPIYMGLLASAEFDGADLSSLKYCLSGGAPCPEDLHREWLERTDCPLLEGWGMSEGAPFCLNPHDDERRLLSVGNPVPETEVEVVDLDSGTTVLPAGATGEVRVRGPQLMQRYFNNADETEQALRDGWLYTGDIGYVDGGFLYLVDRKKDMVLVGGFNVYPRDVDELLFNHPNIREAATVGKPDERLGEVVVAFVVLDRGQQMDDEEFFDYCRASMVKYKRPVEVYFVDSLPKTGTNKINRLALRERLRQM